MRIISSVSRSCRPGEASFWNLLYTCLPSLNWFPNNQSCYRLLFQRKYPMGHSLHVNNLFGEHFQSQMIGNRICVTPWSHNTLTNFNSPASSFKFYLFEFFKRGELVSNGQCHWTRCNVDMCSLLDTCSYPNVSSGNWPLDTSHSLFKIQISLSSLSLSLLVPADGLCLF